MAELKTKKNAASVDEFLAGISDPLRRDDARHVAKLMGEVTGEPPVMWGSSIVGYGQYHYKYASGREADWMKLGFSPRKASLTLYLMDGFDNYQTLLKKLGKYSTGKSCLYIKSLQDVDMDVLKQLIELSYHQGVPMGSA